MSIADTDTFCAKCDTPIYDESPSGDPKKRKPCPNCGSTARTFSLKASIKVAASVTAKAKVTTYPQALLVTARSLIDTGQHSIAVVVSHMACEVATERALSDAFAKNGIQYLEESVSKLLGSFNIGNPRLRKLYADLTGDLIEDQPFWQKFKESSERRNHIIHRGKIVGEDEARESLKAATDLITHLKQ